MKKFIILVLLSIGFTGNAQEITHDLSNFKKIFVYDGLPVKIEKAAYNKAVVTGQSRDDVSLEIKEGTLKVTLSINHIFKEGDNTQILIYYQDIDELRSKQNASISIGKKIEAKNFTLEAQEGSTITGEFELDNLVSLVRSGGEITPTGIAKHQEVSINTGGKYYAKNLTSEYLNITIKAGGAADVTVSDKVSAKVTAGGTVNVYGDPETIDKSTLFGGKVVRKN